MNLTHVCTSQLECSLKQLMIEAPPEVWSAVFGVLILALIISVFKRLVR